MKRTAFMILMSGVLLAGTMLAQVAPGNGNGGQRGFRGPGPERMFQGLNLTVEQKTQIQALRQNQRTQMQALRGNTSLTEEQKKQQARELRQANHQQVLAILTPEQQAKMKQMQARQAGRRQGFAAGRRFQALNLSEQQKEQMKPIFESTRQQMQALRADTSLTPEQRREKMQQIRQGQMSQLKSILTPEQQQQMQQRGRRFHRGGDKPAPPPTGF